MPLTLYVDGPRWRAHLTETMTASPGLIPVAKGNGYGFGLARLARRAEWLHADTLAVGSYREVADVERRFSGDIMVLEPWRPFLPNVPYGDRIIHTVTRATDLTELAAAVARPRIVLEGLTSMCRYGFTLADLAAIGAQAANGRAAAGVRLVGHALHLPLGGGHLPEVEEWLAAAPAAHWYVSHLDADELSGLRRRHPDITFRPRIGTALWLGDRTFLSSRATVLDVHPVSRGDRVGYRQRPIPRDGRLVVVAGGTSHGIALEAPAAAASARQRAVSLARGGLDAAGRALSPYVIDGKHRWFVEPPHMQVSMLFLPAGAAVPTPGDEVSVQVRNTTTTFDRVLVS
jgi:Alanine racemase, N-terminal domain